MASETRTVPDEIDRIESPQSRRAPRRLLTVTVGVVALGLVLAHGWPTAGRQHPHPKAAPAIATSTPPAQVSTSPAARTADYGSVFLEPLAQCLQTDHRRHIRVALAVTNLTTARLRLITATLASSPSGLHLAAVRFWTGPCGASVVPNTPTLPPSGHVVVAFTLDVGPSCPAGSVVTARITFTAHGRRLQTESPDLVDLTRLGFAQCAHG